MRKLANFAVSLTAVALLTGGITISSSAIGANAVTIAKGKEVATNRKTGNCLACHAMGDGVSPGDIGPPLVAMKARFPDRDKLIKQISDPESNNPNTRMPPFGKHKMLSKSDIEAIADYLYTL